MQLQIDASLIRLEERADAHITNAAQRQLCLRFYTALVEFMLDHRSASVETHERMARFRSETQVLLGSVHAQRLFGENSTLAAALSNLVFMHRQGEREDGEV